MQKYNQGFGCFGPMEKCDTGKWVKSEDAEKQIGEYRKSRDEFCDAWLVSTEALSDQYLKLAVVAALAIIGWGIIAVGLARYAFTGAI